MLRGIQNATRGWLGRIVTGIILGLIAISFAVWGIGDIFRGFGQSTVARVGGTDITIEQFRTQYNDRLQQLIRQIGRPIPSDQARALGFPRQVLNQMLFEAAFDESVRQLGLNVPNEVVAQTIRNNPAFRGITGQFDPVRFQAIIRQANFTEARFVQQQRKDILQQQLVRTLTGNLTAPTTAVEAQDRFQNELRALDYFLLAAEQAGEIADPTPDVIAKYFEERKALFRAPELRKIDVIVLSPEELAKTVTVTDEEVKKAYEADLKRYITPERREVQQIVFPTEEEARAAVQVLAQPGMTFEQFSTAPERKGSYVNLGLVSKTQVLDPAVSEAAFTLQSGQTSEPVKGRFGVVLVHVGKIEPEVARSLADVSADIRRDIALTRNRDQVRDLYDKIEDERGAGGALADIAKKLNAPIRTIEAIDRSGRGADGQPVPDLPVLPALFSGIFNAEVGTENDPVPLSGNNGYVWYEVKAVTPSRERPFDEVRDRVVERWKNDQISVRLKELANDATEKLKTGSIGEVAAAFKAKPQFIAGIKRDRTQGDFPSNALEAVFQTPKDSVGSAEGDGAAQWVVFRVTGVTIPEMTAGSDDAKKLQAALGNLYAQDITAQYISAVQADLRVTINEAALNQAAGGTN